VYRANLTGRRRAAPDPAWSRRRPVTTPHQCGRTAGERHLAGGTVRHCAASYESRD